MRVKNLSAKLISFGQVTLLPGAEADLPPEYTESTPSLLYYFRKNLMVKVAVEKPRRQPPPAVVEALAPVPTPSPVAIDEPVPTTTPAPETIDAPVVAPTGNDPEPIAARPKYLSQMNLTELRARATELGISFDESLTKDALKEKIQAHSPEK